MSDESWQGSIIRESLRDEEVLKNFEIHFVQETDEENPSERWHVYSVQGSQEDIEKLTGFLKEGPWYAHFWNEQKAVIAVFAHKIFRFQYADKKTWGPVIRHGLTLGIPEEQLDFLIE